MVRLDIPGFGQRDIEHLVLDFNGTLAEDGRLVDGVAARLHALSRELRITVITADTFGRAREELAGLPVMLHVLAGTDQARAKLALVEALGAMATACIGNGRNDRLMLAAAGLGIAVVQKEGASSAAIVAAAVVARDIREALDLLAEPRRLTATLRD
jgi:soluble P-type ATPase